MWNKCGMARNKKDLESAIKEISALRKIFGKMLKFLDLKMSLMKSLLKLEELLTF